MKERLIGLDLLRSIIMFFGPTFHASMLLTGAWGFEYSFGYAPELDAALDFTHYFRMELFFLISGFFSALVITKKGRGRFVENRVKRIIVPTLASIAIILPLISLEMSALFADRQWADYLSYKHLWFLVTLSMISLLVMLAPVTLSNAIAAVARRLNALPWLLLLPAMACLVYGCMAFNSLTAPLQRSHEIFSLLQINQLINYLPFYFIGMVLYYLEKRITLGWSVAFAGIYILWYLLFKADIAVLAFVSKVSKGLCALLICLGIFFVFKNLKMNASAGVTFLTSIALPFYLVHLPVLLLLAWMWMTVGGSHNPYYFMLFVIPSTCLLSVALGYQMTRYKLLRLLFGLSEVNTAPRPPRQVTA